MATLNLTFMNRVLPGPAPALAEGAAHIWRIDLHRPMPDHAHVLSAEERSRAALMRHEGAKSTFETTRIALRLILSAYTGMEPAQLSIVLDARGKPGLDFAEAPAFNVSHSGSLALIAVTRAGAIGVDVEMLRDAPRLDDLAARFFAADEVAALRALAPDERLDAFYACWTRKEAYVKAEGSGIANRLSDFEVSIGRDEPARMLAIGGDAMKAASHTLHAFRPADKAWGAVCIAAADVDVLGFDLG